MDNMKLRRRNFLKGAFGVTVALPFLESLYISEAAAEEVDHRFGVFIRQPSGVITEGFWPGEAGAFTNDLVKNTSLSPLGSVASQILLIRGIQYRNNNEGNGCHHATGMAQMYTGTAQKRTASAQNNIQALGESLDNRIAREFNHAPLCMYAHGNHDSRYMTSFKPDGSLQNSVYYKPYAAYASMFSMQETPASETAKGLFRKSAVDYVREELQELMKDKRLAATDKKKLEDHFALVRQTETKMATITKEKLAQLQSKGNAEKATAANGSMQEIIKLHMDVIVLAISGGLRKAANLQIGDIINQIVYSNGWVEQHENTHHCDTQEKINKQIDYDRLHSELFKYLVDQFNTVKIGNKTLLDHGFVVMASEVGDGRRHNLQDIPYLIAGGLNGYLKQGHYVKLSNTKNVKLLNTLGAGMGLKNKSGDPLDDFGDTSGGDEYKGHIDVIKA